MRHELLFSAFAGAALVAAAVVAADPGSHRGPHGPMKQAIDTDDDGRITAAEWQAHFTALDADGDGVLADDELPGFRHHGPPPAGAIAGFLASEADADGDGSVTEGEFDARVEALDADGDGALSHTEMRVRRRSADVERAPEGLPPFLAELDTDADSKLDVDELKALFAKADGNGDGILAGDEIMTPRFFHGRHH